MDDLQTLRQKILRGVEVYGPVKLANILGVTRVTIWRWKAWAESEEPLSPIRQKYGKKIYDLNLHLPENNP